jgi:organic radical activating enzyme
MTVLEITTRIGCRVACVYCPQQRLISAYKKKSAELVMNPEVFASCLRKVPSGVRIIFCGMCEPFLNPRCTEMIIHACEKGHSVSVETTLEGMSEEDIARLGTIKLEYLAIHLASAAGDERVAVDERYLALLTRLAAGDVKTGSRYFHYYGADLHPKISALGLPVRQLMLHSRSRNIAIAGKAPPERIRGAIKCERDLDWNVLLPNGDVVLCSSDYNLQHPLGNLLMDEFSALHEGDEFRKVQQGLLQEDSGILCRYCESFARKIK